MARSRLEERRRQAQANVARGRLYVQQHIEVASVVEREGRNAHFVRQRIGVFRELLKLHERNLERIEAGLLEADLAPGRGR